MTLKEALRITKEFGFARKTVTTEASGCDHVYHYFVFQIGDIQFMLSNDDSDNGDEWYGTVFDFKVKFYTIDSFVTVLLAIKRGEWDADTI
jgi:hypothetical protein